LIDHQPKLPLLCLQHDQINDPVDLPLIVAVIRRHAKDFPQVDKRQQLSTQAIDRRTLDRFDAAVRLVWLQSH
jgi:hypothetical protein